MYSVHGLIRLSEDVKKFEALNKFSAFDFKKFLEQLKQMINKPEDPLLSVKGECPKVLVVQNS